MQVSPVFYLQKKLREMSVDEFASLFWLPSIDITVGEYVFNFDKQLSKFADKLRSLYYNEPFNSFFYYVMSLFEQFKDFVAFLDDQDFFYFKGKYYTNMIFKFKE